VQARVGSSLREQAIGAENICRGDRGRRIAGDRARDRLVKGDSFRWLRLSEEWNRRAEDEQGYPY
jgi:hypothetical protein